MIGLLLPTSGGQQSRTTWRYAPPRRVCFAAYPKLRFDGAFARWTIARFANPSQGSERNPTRCSALHWMQSTRYWLCPRLWHRLSRKKLSSTYRRVTATKANSKRDRTLRNSMGCTWTIESVEHKDPSLMGNPPAIAIAKQALNPRHGPAYSDEEARWDETK